ncbi:MAG: selenocysteine-specific translation elongation factor [Bryobacteraceae bacterium]|nr:selenocysteine-specific translation elongation factor [Bryobacteraceae bacterium]
MKNVIVGTAGHIDHGKSTLTRALTGVDTDRLAEEKRRGISIDLGFAHLPVASGLSLGFVDVPGHERFVKNMLAGASGIDLALLVVAATESIKPQTREHFDICRLLGIQAGVVAITKSDLVDADLVELVKLEVAELVAGSFLEGAPIIPVSATTGAGLPELRDALTAVAERVTTKSADAWFRLPVDRVFTMKGHGTVVTGTLMSGQVRVEDEVRVYPEGLTARVRGIQKHGQAARQASAGQRVALNLAGVEKEQLRRGQVLAAPVFAAVTRLDARLKLLPGAKPLKRGAPVHFHAGTAEVEASVIPLDARTKLEPGTEALVRFELQEPTLLLPGDRFIVRLFSPVVTIGGGTVIDVAPPRRAGPFASREARAEAFAGDPVGALLQESPGGLLLSKVIARTGRQAAQVPAGQRVKDTAGTWLLHPPWMAAKSAELQALLKDFHAKQPLQPGWPKEEARVRLMAQSPPAVFEALLAETKAVTSDGDLLRLTAHRMVLQEDESAALAKMEALFADAGLAVPATAEVLAQSGIDPTRAKTLLQALLRDRKLVRINLELVYHATALAQVQALLQQRRGQRFTVGDFKDWTGVSRKYAIPLLEFLDRQRLTRRDGDQRVIA